MKWNNPSVATADQGGLCDHCSEEIKLGLIFMTGLVGGIETIAVKKKYV